MSAGAQHLRTWYVTATDTLNNLKPLTHGNIATVILCRGWELMRCRQSCESILHAVCRSTQWGRCLLQEVDEAQVPAPDALQQRKAKKALPPRNIDLTRFYHARTCIRMTKAEVERILLDPQRASDSDDEEDVEDWKVHIIVVVPDSGAGLAPSTSQSKAHSKRVAHKGMDKVKVCCKAPCRFSLGLAYCPLYVQRNDFSRLKH